MEYRMKEEFMGELHDAPFEAGSSIEDGFKVKCICCSETNVDRIAIMYLAQIMPKY